MRTSRTMKELSAELQGDKKLGSTFSGKTVNLKPYFQKVLAAQEQLAKAVISLANEIDIQGVEVLDPAEANLARQIDVAATRIDAKLREVL